MVLKKNKATLQSIFHPSCHHLLYLSDFLEGSSTNRLLDECQKVFFHFSTSALHCSAWWLLFSALDFFRLFHQILESFESNFPRGSAISTFLNFRELNFCLESQCLESHFYESSPKLVDPLYLAEILSLLLHKKQMHHYWLKLHRWPPYSKFQNQQP